MDNDIKGSYYLAKELYEAKVLPDINPLFAAKVENIIVEKQLDEGEDSLIHTARLRFHLKPDYTRYGNIFNSLIKKLNDIFVSKKSY